MRVGIDARFLTHPQRGGFKRYTENLVRGLAAVDATNEYVLYTDRLVDGLTFPPNFRIHPLRCTLPLIALPWREQVLLPRQARGDRLDLLHSPCVSAPLRLSCPSVVTFHDSFYAIPVIASARIPLSKGGWQREYLRVAQRVAARRAAAVLTVSESAKAGIVRHFALPPESVAVTLEAAAPCFRRVSDPDTVQRVCARYGLRPGFIMALGSPDPRKNVAAVIDAYAALPAALREQHPLAIVWTHPRLAPGIALYSQQRNVSQEICFLPSVPDDELAVLYSSAAVFVFPSLGEGFGLPPLEAMACGAPVIAADTSAVPEVVGSAAILIDPADCAALTTAMVRVLEDATCRDALSRAGRARAADFSWERCARQTRAVYQRVVSDRAERATEQQLDSALGTGG